MFTPYILGILHSARMFLWMFNFSWRCVQDDKTGTTSPDTDNLRVEPCAASAFLRFPGFRFAPLLQLTLQDRLWANLWSRLRRLVHRCSIDYENQK